MEHNEQVSEVETVGGEVVEVARSQVMYSLGFLNHCRVLRFIQRLIGYD